MALNEDYIQGYASARSFERGVELYETEAVTLLERRPSFIDAFVEGSEVAPYRVRVALHGTGVKRASCTCPYEERGWCKHIVATLVAVVRSPVAPEDAASGGATTIEDRIGELDHSELERLVVDAVKAVPQFASYVEQVLESDDGSAAAPSTIRRMRALSAIGSSDDPAVGEGLNEMLASIEALLDRERTRQALEKLEVLTKRAFQVYESSDDDGEIVDFMTLIARAWIDGALMTTPQYRAPAIADRIARWRREFSDYGFGAELEIAERVMLEGPNLAASSFEPGIRAELARARLRVLARRGETAAYLRLAKRCGERGSYLTMLVHDGQFDRAVTEALKLKIDPSEALDIITLLVERKRPDDALRIGERALELRAPGAAVLASTVRDLAHQRGKASLARRAAEAAVTDWPTLPDYRRLAAMSGTSWSRNRLRILRAIQVSKNDDGVIRIFVFENFIVEAIQRLERMPYASFDLIDAVVRAAIPVDPAWAGRTARKHAEDIMDHGRAQHYHHAARWLSRVRDAYLADKNDEGWATYRRTLLLKHARKHKLVPLLEALR